MVEEQKPAADAAAAAAAAVEASAPMEPSPAQSPANEEVIMATIIAGLCWPSAILFYCCSLDLFFLSSVFAA